MLHDLHRESAACDGDCSSTVLHQLAVKARQPNRRVEPDPPAINRINARCPVIDRAFDLPLKPAPIPNAKAASLAPLMAEPIITILRQNAPSRKVGDCVIEIVSIAARISRVRIGELWDEPIAFILEQDVILNLMADEIGVSNRLDTAFAKLADSWQERAIAAFDHPAITGG
jgi:hypothetical protein